MFKGSVLTKISESMPKNSSVMLLFINESVLLSTLSTLSTIFDSILKLVLALELEYGVKAVKAVSFNPLEYDFSIKKIF